MWRWDSASIQAGERRLVVQALIADGAITRVEAAERLVDELLAAHRAYLPQFT